MTNSTTFPGTVTATTFVGSGASLTSIPLGQVTGSFSGNTAFDTTTLVVDGTNNRVGAGTTTPQKTLEVAGPTRITDGLSNVCDLSMGLAQDIHGFDIGTKFLAPNKSTSSSVGEQFGGAFAISDDGTRFIVGDQMKDIGGTNAGAAFIFTYSSGSWDTGTMIQASDKQAGDNFGVSVTMSADGTKVLVGAHNDDPPTRGTNMGSVYYFTYNSSSSSWSQQEKILGPSSGSANNFGKSVAMSSDGTKAVVGEPNGNSDRGYIYPISHNGAQWVTGTTSPGSSGYNARLYASDQQSGDNFGWTVAISDDGEMIVAGAYTEDTSGSQAGSAYVFYLSGSTWYQRQKIQTSEAGANQYAFGPGQLSMSGDGTRIVGGSYTMSSNTGAAYVFDLSGTTWSQTAKLIASDGQAGDFFGSAVAMNSDGSVIVVGAESVDIAGGVQNIGAGYVFTDGVQTHKLLAPDVTNNAGSSMSICAITRDGTSILMGSPYHDGGYSTGKGAAYIFGPRSFSMVNALNSSTPITADGTQLSFTGQHICVPQGPMSPGLVVSANKNRYVSLNGALTTGMGAIRSSESLPVVSLSNVVSDRSVFGVVDRLEQGGTTERRQVVGATVVTAQKELGDTRVIVNSLGEGAIWVADTNGPLVSGDYITTSHLTGYGQKQDDDILHNSTVAKITMDCDFNPDDVPIQVIKKNDTGNNDLDPYGRIQWEDHPLKTAQKAYTIRYLTVDGSGTDEANAVHRTAFVGCTYHCG